jgi:uncharacterized repeat protein (TIGR03943 family)
MKHWDPRRLARATVLTVWTSFVLWLLLSGEVYRYIGTRTYWVVVFGAAALSVATIAQLVTLRTESAPRPLTAREGAGLAALLAPVLAVAMIPAPSLGASAASARSAGSVLAADALIPSAPDGDDPISFVDIHYASASESYAAALGIVDGYPVELTGFVTHGTGTPPGGFTLTRFAVFCCAADAIPYSVPVMDAPRAPSYEDDTWLRVGGTLHASDGRYVLRPQEIDPVREPQDPYIY